jgi:uncharacterized membrane protein YesL
VKKALFPRAVLSFISYAIVLSVLTVDARYLNDLTCSDSLFSIFKVLVGLVSWWIAGVLFYVPSLLGHISMIHF